MANMTRRAWLAAGGAASVATGFAGSVVAACRPADGNNPYHFQSIPPRELFQQRHFPNVELITHEGKKVHFYDDLVKDRKVVLNVMYSNCQKACPTTTANLVRVQKILSDRIGHDIFMYSITLKPEEDSPKVLKKYAKEHGVGPGWLFLTGKPGDIELLRHSLGFVSTIPRKANDKSSHINLLRFGNEPYLRWAACPAQAPAGWVATSILSETDGPLKGGLKGENSALSPQ